MTFQAFEKIDGDTAKGLVLLADHARRALPPEYGTLGLPASEFERHIAYDIGVEAVTRGLARRLGVPAVLCGFSRLLIDPNRGEDDPTRIMQLSDGAVVPGNHPMTAEERELRVERFWRPYHAAVTAALDEVTAATGKAPLVVSIHSFTPAWKGRPRPWHAGILWDSDPRAVEPVIAALREDPDLVVGDNEPYDGALRGDTMFTHCIVPGFPHVLIEVRQDLIAGEAGQAAWVDRLAPILDAVNALPDIHEVKHFGSRTGPI